MTFFDDLLINSPPNQFNDIFNDFLNLSIKINKNIKKQFNDFNLIFINKYLLSELNYYDGFYWVVDFTEEGLGDVVIGEDVIVDVDMAVIDVDTITNTVTNTNDKGSLKQNQTINTIKIQFNHETTETTIENSKTTFNYKNQLFLLNKRLENYKTKTYPSGHLTISLLTKDLIVLFFSEVKNNKNYYNGKFTSKYLIHFLSETEIEITGEIKIKIHYFEDGNVQLNCTKPVKRLLCFNVILINKRNQIYQIKLVILLNVLKIQLITK